MTNIKQLILTLVALLAVTTGAWAADVLNIVVSGTSATIKYDGNSSNNPYLSEIGWEQSGDPWDMYLEIRTNITTVTIDGSCKNFSGTSLNSLFSGFSGLTTINGLENLNTANVQKMASMFDRCSSLTSLDLSSWNTASVTTMSVMFTGCSKLTSLDLSSWNTENVEMTYSTFSECSELTTVDLSGWNTAKVVNTNYMFGKCPKLENIYVGDGWSTAAVTTSNNMFKGCTKLLSMNTANPATDKTNAHTGDGGYLKVKPSGPTVAWDKATKTGTFTMPGGNVELQVEYYPGMLTLGSGAIEGGKLEIVGMTDDALPEGFEKDAEGNIYVKKGTEFTVKAVPAEGFHLVSWSDDATITDLERTITMGDEDLTFTATFSDKYNVALNAEGLSDEEAAAWKAATGTDQPAAFPLENVKAGTEVKVTYTGTKKVIGVKAEKKAAAKPLANATTEDLGKVVGADGNIYANKDAAEAVATGNAVAMICYVNEGHGLALALSDISSYGNSWDNSSTFNEGKTAAELCSAWNTSKAVTGATWKLASLSEMNLMINAAGGYAALRDGFSAVGGTNMIDDYYWVSDESSADYAKNINFGGGYDMQEFKDNSYQVRACLEW